MQDLVGIIRTESELRRALDELDTLSERAAQDVGIGRTRLQPGMEPRHRPPGHAHRVPVGHQRCPRAAREPRRAHPRRLPVARPRVRQGQPGAAHRRDGAVHAGARARSSRCRPSCKSSSRRSRTDGRRDDAGVAGRPRWRRVHRVRHARGGGRGRPRRDPPDPGRPRPRPRLPMELQGGQVWIVLGRDQRPAQADVHDPHGRAARGRARRGGAHAHVPHHP